MATTTFTGFGTTEVGAGAAFNLTGKGTILAGQTLLAAGTLTTSSLANAGVIETLGGTITVNGAVTSSGVAVISGGLLDLTSSFTQTVTFVTSGTLELAQSQSYTGNIVTFSKTGNTFLDLLDIGFVSSSEAMYSGTKTSGILTVSDGTHTALIAFKGNYLGSTFVCSSDGHGGVLIHDPKAAAAAPPPAAQAASPPALASAMAGLAPPAAAVAVTPAADAWRPPTTSLARPLAQAA
jgi:hypothetical protein